MCAPRARAGADVRWLARRARGASERRIGVAEASGALARAGRQRWHNRAVSIRSAVEQNRAPRGDLGPAGSALRVGARGGADSRGEQVAARFAERVTEQEQRLLSPLAARSYPALRTREERDCSLRTPFQRDRDRIVHSKAFRRLTHKTQVFIAPRGDHYRTRLTHTLEVTSISRTFARDFRHYEHSLRIVERLERDGVGLNLTEQVREGIERHSSRTPPPSTLEGRIVRIIDRVAYINHDIDDALRAGLLRERDLPREPIAALGDTGSARIDALVHDMVEHSQRAGDIVQGPVAGAAMAQLREFMFERVYLGPAVRAEHAKIAAVLRRLFEHYVEHPEQLP